MRLGRPKASDTFLLGGLILLMGLCSASMVSAQSGSSVANSEVPRLSTLKLPDGAIVILARSLDDPNVPVDGVVLSAKEYESLIDQLEQAKKFKEAVRPIIPSFCQIRGKIVQYGVQPVASLTITYKFVVTTPLTTVALGGARGFLRAAEWSQKQVPVLKADKDGLVAVVDTAGEYTLTLTMEALVNPRGPVGSIGFDLALPRSPITKLQFAPPNATAKEMVVGIRTLDRPGEITRNSFAMDRLSGPDGVPLGPTDLLELIWEVPPPPGTVKEIPREAETEVAVRIDELRVETQAKIRLKGTSKEWRLDLPRGAEVRIDRVELPPGADLAANFGFPLAAPVLLPPADKTSTLWTVKSPDLGKSEWTVTVQTRQTRPGPTSPEFPGPYTVGPFHVVGVRQTGTIRVSGPDTVQTSFELGPTVHQKELAADADPELMAQFVFTEAAARPGQAVLTPSPAPPLLRIQATQAVGFLRIEPSFQLNYSVLDVRQPSAEWRLAAQLAITPIRTEARELDIELPGTWDKFEAGPLDLVDGVTVTETMLGRRYRVRLYTGQRRPFTLTLKARRLIDPGLRAIRLEMPRFPDCLEQTSRLQVAVPEGLTLRGQAEPRFKNQVEMAVALTPPTPIPAGITTAIQQLVGTFEKGIGKVDLQWDAYRPELPTRIETDITLFEQQAKVEQIFYFGPVEPSTRPIRFRTSANLPANLRFSPPLTRDAIDGDLIFRPPAGAREFSLRATFWPTIPAPAENPSERFSLSIPLVWSDSSTRAESLVRVWGNLGAPRVEGFSGPWEALPLETVDGRELLPALRLITSEANPSLSLELTMPDIGQIPPLRVERALIQSRANLGEEFTRIRARFMLRRWPITGIMVELPAGVTPDISLRGLRITQWKTLKNGSDRAAASPDRQTIVLPLPPPSGELLPLEIRYLIATPSALVGTIPLQPPLLLGATFAAPIQWQSLFPAESTILLADRRWNTELYWTWRGAMLVPTAGASDDQLDRWLTEGVMESRPSGGSDQPWNAEEVSGLMLWQSTVAPVTVYRLPWSLTVTVSSLLVLMIALIISRTDQNRVLLMAGVAIVWVVLIVLWPQPMAQIVAASQPGWWVILVIMGLQLLFRWYVYRRVRNLPGFSRGRKVASPTSSSVTGRAGPGGSGHRRPGSGGGPGTPAMVGEASGPSGRDQSGGT
jgi:hypothetical protein